VRVSSAQLRDLAKILERLEEGRIATPRVPGAIGAFIRQYAQARERAALELGHSLPGRGWISGEDLMPLELVPIGPLELRIGSDIIGSATHTIAVSETLGATTRVTLWGAALAANRLLRVWRREPESVVRLIGRYRWYPPARITPGEAQTDETGTRLPWHQARCLKYTGDDLGRAPHAAAFHLDWLTDPPGLKAFRAFAIRRDDATWRALPGLRTAPDLDITLPDDPPAPDADQLLVLAWTQPWKPSGWRVVDAVPATDNDVLAHNISWADHIRELNDEPQVSGDEMRALRARAREAGMAHGSIEVAARQAQLTRRLSPRALSFARLLRGVS
jgi:hypothetical protein